jgi:hypothetical protein
MRQMMIGSAFGLTVSTLAWGQTIVGDTVRFWQHSQATGTSVLVGAAVVTSPDHEYATMIDSTTLFRINVEAMSIRLESMVSWNSPYFNSGHSPSSIEIRDLDFVGEPHRFITGVSVSYSSPIGFEQNAPSGYPSFSADNISFTADSVRISYGGYEFPAGSFIHINLITAIPTPGATAALGLGALVAARRQRR